MFEWHNSFIVAAFAVMAIAVLCAIHMSAVRSWVSIHTSRIARHTVAETQVTHRTGAGLDGLLPLWVHTAPDGELNVVEAHKEMQRHCYCTVPDCPRKTAAFTTLVQAGKIKPDSSRQRM
ncbi:hypothetical protein [Nocardia thraciensis]